MDPNKSVDFPNYSTREEAVKNGALVMKTVGKPTSNSEATKSNENVEVLGEILLPIPNEMFENSGKDKLKLTMELRFTHPKKIAVKNVIESQIDIDVEPTDSVADVKRRLSALENIPPNEQKLYLSGNELNDSLYINDFYLDDSAVLDLVCVWRVGLKNRRTGECSELDFWTTDNVRDLRAKFCDKNNLNFDAVRFFYKQQLMEDNEKVTAYIKYDQSEIIEYDYLKIIRVRTPAGLYITLEVWPSEKISDLKKRISEIEGIDPSHQRLLHRGKAVEDSVQFSNCNIDAEDSVLDLDTLFFINTRVSGNSSIPIQVWSSDTIASIKENIASSCGLNVKEHRLVFQNLELEDKEKISNYNIPQFAELIAEQRLELMISIPNKSTLLITVWPSESISDLKTRIASEIGAEVDKLRLSIEGAFLEDNRRVVEYLIEPESILNLDVMWRLVVLSPVGKRVILEVWSSASVNALKELLEQLEGIPKSMQRLSFDGKILMHDTMLMDYGMQFDSLLKLDYLRPVVVATSTGQLVSVEVWHSDLVLDLKRRLESKGIPMNQLRITVGDEILEDNFHLKDCVFNKDIIPKIETMRRISISVASENVEVDVWPEDSVMDLKKKVCGIRGVDIQEQRLILRNEELNDATEISDTNCFNDSVLEMESAIPVSIQTPFGNMKLKIWPSQTFKTLKDRIEGYEGMPASRIRVKLPNGVYPMDTSSISQYSNTSMIQLDYLLTVVLEDYVTKVKSRVDVWTFETIEDFKNQCVMPRLRFYHRNLELSNDTKFSDSRIVKDPLIQVEKISVVTVRFPSGEIHQFEVWPSDRLQCLKDKISAAQGVPSSGQLLTIDGKIVEPTETISFIQNFVVDLECLSQVSLIEPKGYLLNFDVWRSDLVGSLVIQASNRLKTPNDRLRLRFEGKHLTEDQRLPPRAFTENATIIIEESSLVNVKGQLSFSCYVWLTDPALKLKMKIEEETGVAVDRQNLNYLGRVLEDTQVLIDVGIEAEASITLEVMRKLTILQDNEKEPIVLSVWPCDSILKIKEILENLTGVSSSHQKLMCKGKEMNDMHRLSFYFKKEDSLEVHFARGCCLNVALPNKMKSEIDMWSTDCVSDLKGIICDMEGKKPQQQRLTVDNEELKDEQKILSLALKKSSIIYVEFLPEVTVKKSPDPTPDLVLPTYDSPESLKEQQKEIVGSVASEQKMSVEEEIPNTKKVLKTEEVRITKNVSNAEKVSKTEEIPNTEKISDTEGVSKTEEIPTTGKVLDTEKISDTERVSKTEEIPTTGKVLDTEEVPKTEKVSKTEEMPKTEEVPNTEKVSNTEEVKSALKTEVDTSDTIAESFFTSEAQKSLKVRTTDNLNLTFFLGEWEDVSKLKAIIAERDFTCPDNLMLFNGCRLLADEEKIDVIDFSSSLQVLLRPRENFILIWEPVIQMMTAVEIFQTQCVDDLKRLCIEHLGMQFDSQILVFDDKVLEDHFLLSDVGVQHGSVVTMIRRWVVDFCLLRSDAKGDVSVKPYHCSYEADTRIIFSSRYLNVDRTLESEGLTTTCDVRVVVQPQDSEEIVFRRVGQNALIFPVGLSSTVLDLKLKIEAITGLPASIQELYYYKSDMLTDNQIITSLNNEKDGFFILSYRLKVSVQMLGSKTVNLEVRNGNSVESLKYRLQEKVGVDAYRQRLLLNGVEIENHKSLGSYLSKKVKEASLSLAMTCRELHWVFVRNSDGQVISLDVSPCDSVSEMKQAIARKTGIAPEKQRLLFNEEVLSDQDVLVKKGIPNEAMLTLEVRTDEALQIEIRDESARRKKGLRFDVRSSDRIIDVKAKMEAVEELPRHTFDLFFDSIQLADTAQLMCYDVPNGAVLIRSKVAKLPVFVRAVNGKEVELQVCSTITVQKLKRKLKSVIKVAPSVQQLYLAGQLLADDRCLFSYATSVKAMTLFLARSDGDCIWVFIRNSQGATIALRYCLSESLSSLGTEVKTALKIRGDRVRLMLDRIPVNDWF